MFEINSPFTMVAIIMICVTAMAYFKHRSSGQRSPDMPDLAPDLDSLKREVSELRQRVLTLEKIATDPEEKLKREFERL